MNNKMNPYKKINTVPPIKTQETPKSTPQWTTPVYTLNSNFTAEQAPIKTSVVKVPEVKAVQASTGPSITSRPADINKLQSKQNDDLKARLVTPTVSIKAQLRKQISMLKKQDIIKTVTTQTQASTKRNLDEAFTKTSEDIQAKQKLRREQKQALIKERMAKLEEKLQPRKPIQAIMPKDPLQSTFSVQAREQLMVKPDNVMPQVINSNIQIVPIPVSIPAPTADVLLAAESTHQQTRIEKDTELLNASNVAPHEPMKIVAHPYPQHTGLVQGFHYMMPYHAPLPFTPYNVSMPMVHPFNRISWAVPSPHFFQPVHYPQRPHVHPPTMNNIVSQANMKKSNLRLHKEPMDLPSPYARSHILLPFEIQITKVKGQAFGIEIRYESQGTYIVVEERVAVYPEKVIKATIATPASNAAMDPIPGQGSELKEFKISSEDTLEESFPDSGVTPVAGPTIDSPCHGSGLKVSTDSSSATSGIKCSDSAMTSIAALVSDTTGHDSEWKESTDPSTATSDVKSFHSGVTPPIATAIDSIPADSNLTEPMTPRVTALEYSPSDSGDVNNEFVQEDIPLKFYEISETQAKNSMIMTGENDLGTTNVTQSMIESQSKCQAQAIDDCNFESTPTCYELMDEGGEHPLVSISGAELQNTATEAIVSQAGESKINEGGGETTSRIFIADINSAREDVDIASISSNHLSGSKEANLMHADSAITRKRKKRLVYGVMSVVNATKQNERASSLYNVAKDHTLQPGDIILKIDDTEVCGLFFSEASSLFSKCSTNLQHDSSSIEKEPIIICRLKVAREKKVVKILEKLNSLSCQSAQMDAALRETTKGTNESVKANDFSNEIPVIFRDYLVNMAKRIGIDLKHATYDYIMNCDDRIYKAESLFWEKTWSAEAHAWKTDLVRLTDAQRSRMRSLPKPFSGCKCGSPAHEFVDDIQCPLYSDLRVYGTASFIPRKRLNHRSAQDSNINTSAIDAAHLHRERLIQERVEAEENEANFVAEMENIQVNHLRKAIFAPRLSTTMLLSAIVHLSQEGSLKPSNLDTREKAKEVYDTNDNVEISDDEDDLEDDVPLTSLGVDRSSTGCNLPSPQPNACPSFLYLARVLRFISQVWGHVFQEPDPFTFAWYEESKRSMNKARTNATPMVRRNPRKAGSCTFERFRFVLDDDVMNRLSVPDELSEINFRDRFLISYLVSNKVSGLLGDISSLIKFGVVRIDDSSNVVLSPSWIEKVPHLILTDMWESGWHALLDRENKFCISESLREQIDCNWRRSDEGWVFGDSLKYRHDELEEQKLSFQVMYDEQVNTVDGIGQFGV